MSRQHSYPADLDAVRTTAREMALAGKPSTEIAATLGVPKFWMKIQLTRMRQAGVLPEFVRKKPPREPRRKNCTAEEIGFILAERAAGRTQTEIAEAMNRSRKTIEYVCRIWCDHPGDVVTIQAELDRKLQKIADEARERVLNQPEPMMRRITVELEKRELAAFAGQRFEDFKLKGRTYDDRRSRV